VKLYSAPLESEPPIVQGRKTWRGRKWRTYSTQKKYSAGFAKCRAALVLGLLTGESEWLSSAQVKKE
jgi:hypothetical protein